MTTVTGKADTKKGDATAKTNTAAGATGARRASVSELKGLVEIRARSQAMRAGAGAVTAEGRPLLKVGGDVHELRAVPCLMLFPLVPPLTPFERCNLHARFLDVVNGTLRCTRVPQHRHNMIEIIETA